MNQQVTAEFQLQNLCFGLAADGLGLRLGRGVEVSSLVLSKEATTISWRAVKISCRWQVAGGRGVGWPRFREDLGGRDHAEIEDWFKFN